MFTPLSIHNRPSLPLLLVMTFLFFAANAAVASPALPAINTNNIINVLNYGAVGDGITTNTVAIQNAINAAAAGGTTNGAAGGTVEFPGGIFLCGPITLKSAVNIQLDSGAILRMLPFGQYPVTWHTNGSAYYFTAADFLSGSSLHDLEISGTGWIQGQGEPWWPWANTNGAVRPRMITLSGCHRTLITSVTLSNSPEFHIACSTSCGDTTVRGVTIHANSSSDPIPGHNTDACDASGTNTLVVNCNISVGDDNYTCGGPSSNILITNNTYGAGHGTSIGSYTSPSVSNLTIVNCTYTNTDAGIRIKTDRDRGGYVHDLMYYNLTMSSVRNPILIYTEYTNSVSMYRALDSISPAVAASYPSAPVTSTTPRYRNITISNLTATAQSGRTAGLIWGLPESCVSNVTLLNVHLTGSKTFGIYDAKNVRIIDCSHSVPTGVSQFSFFNADITFSNSTPATSIVTLDGATTNAFANQLSFYNARMTLKNTNAIALNSSITLGASTFIISNNLALTPSNSVNFVLGTNAATMVVKGNLALDGTNNIMAGAGFTNGTYTLFTYTGSLSGGLPMLGTTPAGYNCSLDISTHGQVNLIVSPPAPAIPANLTASATNLAIGLQWSASANATGYNVKRSTTNGGPYSIIANLPDTNLLDAAVNPGVTYYYVVSATNAAGESGNSSQVAAVPLPSLISTNISFQANGSQLQLSWPADHLGWRLQVQTNDTDGGLGTNWLDVPDTSATNQFLFSVGPNNTSVFWRLVYP